MTDPVLAHRLDCVICERDLTRGQVFFDLHDGPACSRCVERRDLYDEIEPAHCRLLSLRLAEPITRVLSSDVSWTVYLHPDAEIELAKLPPRERIAVDNAMTKLRAIGPNLGHPHSSRVQGIDHDLRELRPRQGRSPWRAFYARVGEVFVVAAIGPEARQDRRGFDRAVTAAIDRLSDAEAG
jgi:hypothetical protein